MTIENKIELLSNLINKYDVDYINRKFKEIEVNHALELLNKAKYSELMKKRILAEAKRKSISKNRRQYIQSIIDKNNNFQANFYRNQLEHQINHFFTENFSELKQSIGFIYFEHDYSPNIVRATIYGNHENSKYKNEIKRQDTKIDFTPIWGFIEERKFINMAESLEAIDIEDYEYPIIFEELFKLRSYKIVKEIINSENIVRLIRKLPIDKNFYIEIGEHDNWKYEIFRNKNAKV